MGYWGTGEKAAPPEGQLGLGPHTTTYSADEHNHSTFREHSD